MKLIEVASPWSGKVAIDQSKICAVRTTAPYGGDIPCCEVLLLGGCVVTVAGTYEEVMDLIGWEQPAKPITADLVSELVDRTLQELGPVKYADQNGGT